MAIPIKAKQLLRVETTLMPPRQLPTSRLYSRLLFTASGYPLWRPEPNENLPEYCIEGVQIGDVGILTSDGGFDFLFNVCNYPAGVNRADVPASFVSVDRETLEIDRHSHYHDANTDIKTSSVQRLNLMGEIGISNSINATPSPVGLAAKFQLRSTCSEGAVLMLPEGGSREDLLNTLTFENLARKHAADWFHYATVVRNRRLPNDSLYLVTGCDKTVSWGVAAFSQTTQNTDCTLKFVVKGVGGVGDTVAYDWESSHSVSARTGPAHSPQSPNQCVLLRGFRIYHRKSLLSRLPKLKIATLQADDSDVFNETPSSTYNMPSSSSSSPSSRERVDSGIIIEDFPEVAEPFHPLDVVNRAILDRAGCKTAIIHDEVWCSIAADSNSDSCELLWGPELIDHVLSQYTIVAWNSCAVLERTANAKDITFCEYDSSISEGPPQELGTDWFKNLRGGSIPFDADDDSRERRYWSHPATFQPPEIGPPLSPTLLSPTSRKRLSSFLSRWQKSPSSAVSTIDTSTIVSDCTLNPLTPNDTFEVRMPKWHQDCPGNQVKWIFRRALLEEKKHAKRREQRATANSKETEKSPAQGRKTEIWTIPSIEGVYWLKRVYADTSSYQLAAKRIVPCSSSSKSDSKKALLVHRHSRVLGFSLGWMKSESPSSSNPPPSSLESGGSILDGAVKQTRKNYTLHLLATRDVQQSYPSTDTVRRLEEWGLLASSTTSTGGKGEAKEESHPRVSSETTRLDHIGTVAVSGRITVPDTPWVSFSESEPTHAPSFSKQDEEKRRALQNLSKTFNRVGLLSSSSDHQSTQKSVNPHNEKSSASTSTMIFDGIPRDALFMLIPLWVGPIRGKRKDEVRFLMVWYKSDVSIPLGDTVSATKSSRSIIGLTSTDTPSRTSFSDINLPPEQHKPFNVLARLVSYNELQGSGIGVPDSGLQGISDSSDIASRAPVGGDHLLTDYILARCPASLFQADDDGVKDIVGGVEFNEASLVTLSLAVKDSTFRSTETIMSSSSGGSSVRLTSIGRSVVEIAWMGALALIEFRVM